LIKFFFSFPTALSATVHERVRDRRTTETFSNDSHPRDRISGRRLSRRRGGAEPTP
jgi:hypothetical protein